MKLRVLGKGLILVAVPLVLELVLIASLGYLLSLSDRLYVREAQMCRVNRLGSHLLFGNCRAGSKIVLAFSRRDLRLHMVDRINPICQDIENTSKEISEVLADDPLVKRELLLRYLKAQTAVTSGIREIAQVGNAYLGPVPMSEVLHTYRKLTKDLDLVFRRLETYHQQTDSALPLLWKQMDNLQEAEKTVLFAGLAAIIAGATFSIYFYRSQFLLRINAVKHNVNSLAEGTAVLPRLKGVDEISDLDTAFRNMSMQLSAIAERERALFANSSDLICVLDENLVFVRVNRASVRFCGKEPEQLIGKPVSTILFDSADNDIKQIDERLFSARKTHAAAQFEVPVCGPSGSQLLTLWSVFWSPNEKSCHCVVHDVSEERALDNMRQSFLRLIAADFREPLNSIARLFQKLSSGDCGKLPELATTKIGSATSTLARMVSMVDELIELETMQNTALNLNRQQYKVVQAMTEAIKDTEAAATRKKIEVKLECSPDLSFQVDFVRITRVLTNFISNAIKFSPEGSTITLSGKECAPHLVLISVIDQGRGIPQEILGSLFQPFKQVTAQDGKRGKGTGLGLVTCKRIVEEHGGTVGVESEEGKGSRFWLSLPESIAQLAEVKDTQPTSPATTSPGYSLISSDTLSKSNFWERCSLRQKGILLIGLPLLIQGIFVGAMIYLLSENSQFYALQMHNRRIASDGFRVSAPFFHLLINLRSETQKKTVPVLCQEFHEEESKRLVILRDTVRGDSVADKYYQQLLSFTGYRMFPFVKRLEDDSLKSAGQFTQGQKLGYGNAIIESTYDLTAIADALVAACEERIKETPARLVQLRQYQAAALLAALSINICAAAWLAVYFSADVVRRLLILSDNSQRLASSRELNKPLSGTDEIAHLDAAFHDTATRLSELRASESTFLDNANNIICSLSESGKFVSLNRVAAKLFSIPFERLEDHNLISLLSAEQGSGFKDFLEKVKVSNSACATELQVKAGEQRLDMIFSVTWSATEKLFYAVAYDITARRELDRMKKEFLSLVTHDLRSPLTTIQGMAILLETNSLGILPPESRPVLAEIKRRSNQILDLVNDLLDLAKLEAGEMKADFTPVTLDSILDKAKLLLAEAGTELVLSAFPEELKLEADADRLSYAISGMALEIFGGGTDPLTLQATCSNAIITINIEGAPARLTVQDFTALAAGSLAQYNASSTHRLRLPLSLKLLQLHHGTACLETKTGGQYCLQLCLPSSNSPQP